MVCPCGSKLPYLKQVPSEDIVNAVKKDLAADFGSPDAYYLDSDFTFQFDVPSDGDTQEGKYVLYGVCDENGAVANLPRNAFVSEMLDFSTDDRGTFGPFAFVLMRIEHPQPRARIAVAEDSDAEIGGEDEEEDEEEDEQEVPVDIDGLWPLERILELWKTKLHARKLWWEQELARKGKNTTVFFC